MVKASVAIRTDEPLGTISPNIYGHFAEHLGRCIDEGIWVGPESAIANNGGARQDVTEALAAIRCPVIRWPGGCFADAYDWRDGVGPHERRPRRINVWWNKEEDNQFGTDEFVRFCRDVGAEPYICGNVGSGTPREMMQWVEYCNYEGQTTLARERVANGAPVPHKVKYWGIGNENWGCGGQFGAEQYAHEYRRFGSYLRRIDPTIELISCGHSPEWNLGFFSNLGRVDLVDHHSLHHYYKCGPGTGFSEEEYYGLFPRALELEEAINRLSQLMSHFDRGRRIGIVVDEWGVWHPEADVGLWQPNTLRDALSAAVVLDVFNRQAGVVTMGNIAQTVNVLQCLLQTDGAAMWRTPTYHVFDLYKSHMGNYSLRADVVCERHEFSLEGRREHVLPLSVSASHSEAAGRLVLSLTNLHLTETLEVTVSLHGSTAVSGIARTLTSANADDVNSAAEPDRVCLAPVDAPSGEEFTLQLAPKSTTVGLWELR